MSSWSWTRSLDAPRLRTSIVAMVQYRMHQGSDHRLTYEPVEALQSAGSYGSNWEPYVSKLIFDKSYSVSQFCEQEVLTGTT